MKKKIQKLPATILLRNFSSLWNSFSSKHNQSKAEKQPLGVCFDMEIVIIYIGSKAQMNNNRFGNSEVNPIKEIKVFK